MRARWLVALYPAPWRARYGDEFLALLDEEPVTIPLILDVVHGALAARAAALPSGVIAMRSRTPALVSILAVLLVLPAVTFLTAAMLRGLQPTQYQPAHTAEVVFDAFATLPSTTIWLLLGLAPLVAIVLAATVAWRRLRDDAGARADVAAFAAGWGRILRQPTLVLAAIAAIASAGVLVFAVTHAIAG